MKDTIVALLNSRKFFVGAISLTAVFGSVLLRALNLIPQDALVPTISAITATGLGFMASQAHEDANKNGS